MRKGDFQFATKLANTMNWNMATEDFKFITNLEPDGCFVVFNGGERVGISTSISFGRVGWFGNLIVEEKWRNMGVGSLLVNHSVNYLKNRGAQTIGLYAYPNLVNFYSHLDFKLDEDFWVLHAENLCSLAAEALPPVGKRQVKAVEKFDCRCFGGDRKKLLESIIFEEGNLSCFKSVGNLVLGYVAATVYEKTAWVGPLMCRESEGDIAVSLLKAVLANLAGKSVYTVLPKKEVALADLLFSAGFKEEFFASRMFLGKAVAKNCIYVAESLERG
ncbi:MAG TPA: GNAT family N-acetyltransferase [Candidatus Limnocylindrales bacterium]|nr:GNAT family N-acetyltransferase [Candidatus Limnocylindrales bacterium]